MTSTELEKLKNENCTIEFSVDLVQDKYIRFSAKQLDNNRYAIATITENGKPKYFDGFYQAGVRILKPDGNPVFNKCDIVDGKIVIRLTEQILAVAGCAEGDIIIYEVNDDTDTFEDGELPKSVILSTKLFHIDISDTPYPSESVISSYEFNALNEMMEKASLVATNEDERIAGENDRVSAESIRLASERLRISNEESRVSAEISRVTSESERSNAESTRATAEDTRKENESSRVSAERTRQTNEENRKTAESTRANNENLRQTAEANRNTTFSNLQNSINSEISKMQKNKIEAVTGTNTYKVKVTDKDGVQEESPNLLNILEIGDVDAGDYDEDPSASITGTFGNQKLNLRLPVGKPFKINRVYPSVADMNNSISEIDLYDFIIINTGDVESDENARLYMKDSDTTIMYLTDLSGVQGIQGNRGEVGATPQLTIGSVTTGAPGTNASVTITGSAENPIINLVIPRGDEGAISNSAVSNLPSDANNFVDAEELITFNNDTTKRKTTIKLFEYIKSKLSKVAVSGSYNDLTNKPNISDSISMLDVDTTEITDDENILSFGNSKAKMRHIGSIINFIKSKLATVASTGNYSDLNGKPVIPSVVDNVSSTATTSALSANQGKVLNEVKEEKLTQKTTSPTIQIPHSYAGKAELTDLVHNLCRVVNNTGTVNGATVTTSNELITISGTPTASGGRLAFGQYIPSIVLGKGTYTLSSNGSTFGVTVCISNKTTSALLAHFDGSVANASVTFTLSEQTEILIGLNVVQNLTVNTNTYLMLTKGTLAHTYVPQNYEVVSCGKNLADVDHANYLDKWTKNGQYNGLDVYNKSDALNGLGFTLKAINGKKYVLSAWIKTASGANVRVYPSEKTLGEFTDWTRVEYAYIGKGNTVTFGFANIVNSKMSICGIQLEIGDNATPYKPYQGDTVTITPSTEKAYIRTYDGQTNIFCDTDITATYAISENGQRLLEDMENEITDSYCNITDCLDGYCEVSELVHNEIPYPYTDTTKTESGITFTDNGDGTITVSGTATENARFVLSNSTNLISQDNMHISGGISSVLQLRLSNSVDTTIADSGLGELIPKSSTFSNRCSLFIYTYTGNTYNNVVIKPMLVKGTEPKPYVPYQYEVKSCGKNLYWHDSSNDTKWVIEGNKNYRDSEATFTKINVKPNTNYASNGNTDGYIGSFFDENDNYISAIVNVTNFTSPNNAKFLYLNASLKESSPIYYKILQLEEGTQTPYEQFKGSTYTVNADTEKAYLQTFDGETNVFTDYDVPLKVRYGATEKANERITAEYNDKDAISELDERTSANEVQIDANKMFISSVFFDNAGAHNSLFRGKNLGSSVTAAQWQAIKDGSFKDLYIGDYWVINGVTWRIAHFNKFYNFGDTAFTQNHVSIVPDTNLYSAQMNTTNTTDGGYYNSAMKQTNLAQALTLASNAFGASHIASHRVLLNNAASGGSLTSWAWYSSQIDLMTEEEVYGHTEWRTSGNGGYNGGTQWAQLALFSLAPHLACNRNWYWLGTIWSSTYFASVNGIGNANNYNASNSGGVRPRFEIVA